ncbi:MAG: carboxymethylenebutenolidase, partial [bacterium]
MESGCFFRGLSIFIILSFFTFLIACDRKQSQSKKAVSPTKIITSTVTYSGNIKGFLARPEGDGAKPTVILIHEWWGLNENIRDNARAFAKAGYIALAVDLYSGKVASTQADARKYATEVRSNVAPAFKNLKDAISYLKTQSFVNASRIGSVGWCFGGGWSYQMAKNDLGVKSSVIYYGRFNPKDDLSKMRSTILGHFAEKDRS